MIRGGGRGAVTHVDLEPTTGKTDLGSSRTGLLLVSFTVLCGLISFVLCLIAEATHSQVTWVSARDDDDRPKSECIYSGSGQTPLLCGASAFILMALGMVVEHTYMLIAVSQLPPPDNDTGYWEHDLGSRDKSLTLQAAFLFITTWVCFAVGEMLLLIGLSVEPGHQTNWSRPRPNCLTVPKGLFCAAGVFTLATVFLAVCLYLVALRIQRALHEREMFRRQMAVETSVLSPPCSPQNRSVTRESPVAVDREDPNVVVETTLVSSKMVC